MSKIDFPFYDAPNTAVITCCHVTYKTSPILFASHDEEDGMWQFLCGGEHTEEDAEIVSLYYIYNSDKTIGEISDMPCGCFAERKSRSDKWVIRR